jgi:hypothetical protein
MWSMYKKLLVEDGMSRRDQVLAQAAFLRAWRLITRCSSSMSPPSTR